MTVYSWITNPALRTKRFITHRVGNILEDQEKFNAVQYHYMNTKNNPVDVASRGINLKCDREIIDLWLHRPELLCNTELWKNPDALKQQILVLEDDTQVEIPEQEHVVHIIDRCIARYSNHRPLCKTIAIFSAFCQFWIAMLRTKHW